MPGHHSPYNFHDGIWIFSPVIVLLVHDSKDDEQFLPFLYPFFYFLPSFSFTVFSSILIVHPINMPFHLHSSLSFLLTCCAPMSLYLLPSFLPYSFTDPFISPFYRHFFPPYPSNDFLNIPSLKGTGYYFICTCLSCPFVNKNEQISHLSLDICMQYAEFLSTTVC